MDNKKWLAPLVIMSLVAILSAMITFTGCGSSDAAAKTLKIGGSIALSGPASIAGLGWKNGWQTAIDKLNADGVTIGDTKYTLQLLVEDSQTSPEGANTAATKLCLQDGVKFVMGDIVDFIVPVIYKITSQAGALYSISLPIDVGNIPGGMAEVGADKPLLIRTQPGSSELDILDAQYLAKNYPNAKTVALMCLDFPNYDPYAQVFPANWAPYGIKIASDYQRFAGDAIDFTPQLTRILATHPDAINAIRCSPTQLPLIVRTAREMGFKGPIMHGTQCDNAFIASAGPNTTDVFGFGIAMDDPSLPDSVKATIKLGQDKYGKDFTSDSLLGYDQVMMLVQMMQKAKSIDPKTVQDTLETLTKAGDLQSIFGAAHAGGKKQTGVNRAVVRPVPMAGMINGKSTSLGIYSIDIP